tara:strand:+ start:350 stop:1075 length:726 start_codon:yes stop_codon:yes gene_type:complete
MHDDVAIIMYSHSSYSDAWDMFIGQTNKYFPGLKKYAFIDSGPEKLPSEWEVVQYEEALPYNQRFAYGLEQVTTKYCILHHEDMPLYAPPNMDKINEYIQLLEEDEELHYIKLIKGGEMRQIPYKTLRDVFVIPHNSQYIFAVQPTIWKTDKLRIVYEKTQVTHIREFEPLSQYTCRENDIHGAYCYNYEPRRGMHHFDSSVYPYIATAIVKGQWNLSEYRKELLPLLAHYKIDTEKRGSV